ncbi:universal stress protein [Chloroflexota bacterium]
MEEKILISLDGSKTGETALPYVKELVAKLSPEVKVEITLLQVVSPMSHYVVAGEESVQIAYTEQEMEQIKSKARDYLSRVGESLRSSGATAEIKVGVGDAADEIIKTADEINVDIIAMSTHGRSGLSRWAFGSVTDKVLRGGNRPVLVVRAPRQA